MNRQRINKILVDLNSEKILIARTEKIQIQVCKFSVNGSNLIIVQFSHAFVIASKFSDQTAVRSSRTDIKCVNIPPFTGNFKMLSRFFLYVSL